MPSLFRATVGLHQLHWEYHKRNPGRLSRLCQKAVDREMLFESLPDSLKDQAYDEAAKEFFSRYRLEGDYAVENNGIIRHEATDEQMATDARRFGVPPRDLISILNNFFDIEIDIAMMRKSYLAHVPQLGV